MFTLRYAPSVFEALARVARAARARRARRRSQRPPFGRPHLWDEVARYFDPVAVVTCSYCHVERDAVNADGMCPGPPMGRRPRAQL
jgi:hypothetical protein